MRTIITIILIATLSIFASCGSKKNDDAPVNNNYYANPNHPTNVNPNQPCSNYYANYVPTNNTNNCEYYYDENSNNGWNSYTFFESCVGNGSFPMVCHNSYAYNSRNFYDMVWASYNNSYYYNYYNSRPNGFQEWYCTSQYNAATYGSNSNSFCGNNGFFVSGSIAFNSSNGGTVDASTALGVAALVGLGLIFSSF